MKYKVGDKVRIKSIDWYNKYKNIEGHIKCGKATFVADMSEYCGQIATINDIENNFYFLNTGYWNWTDEMIEGLADETEIAQDAKTSLEGYNQGYEDGQHDMNEWILPEGFEFTDEKGNVINTTKIVLTKKKERYPKTYQECCKILGIDNHNIRLVITNEQGVYNERVTCYEHNLLNKFNPLWGLIICRDAYWKLAGDEMGLGKPWKPDWNNAGQNKYCLYTSSNTFRTGIFACAKCILAFPTEEIRDIFYKNFEKLMKLCMEFL